MSSCRFQKELMLSAVVILLDGIQETLRILLSFCLKDGCGETRTDTNLIPLQTFHLDTELGEKEFTILVSITLGFIRSCIGMRFARMEMYVLLVKFVQKYKLVNESGEVGNKTTLTVEPDRPVILSFHNRY